MKKSITLLGFCLLGMSTHITVIAQKTYTYGGIGFKKSTGYPGYLSDSNLYLFPPALPCGSVEIHTYLPGYSNADLEKIEIKRKDAAGSGAWQGALIGLAAGVITRLVLGGDPAAAYNNSNGPFGATLNFYTNSFRIISACEKL